MKTRQHIAEILLFIVVLDLFFEGIWKITFRSSFSAWLHNAPFIKPFSTPLTYAIPIVEIATALCLLVSKFRIAALNIIILLEFSYIIWIALFHAFSYRLCWPYQEWWEKPFWIREAAIALTVAWLALICRWLYNVHANVSFKVISKQFQFFSFERKARLRANQK